jgi:hypothetical protein
MKNKIINSNFGAIQVVVLRYEIQGTLKKAVRKGFDLNLINV